MDGRTKVDWMVRADLVELIALEKFMWGDLGWAEEEDFIRFGRERNQIVRVGRRGGILVGYVAYSMDAPCLDIVRLVVHRHHQRKGVGRALLRPLMDKAEDRIKYRSCRVVVPESRLDVLGFLKAVGFRATRLLRGLGDEDRILMKYDRGPGDEVEVEPAQGVNRIRGLV